MPWRAQSLQEEMTSLQKLIRTSSTFIYPQYCVLLGNNFSQLNEIFFDNKDTFCVLVTILTLFYLVVFIYSSSCMLCFSFNMFKHLECLCCFLFFHKNVNLKIVCLYDSIELNKHKFIIATIIISNIKNFHFPFKVLLFQGCLLDLHCIHFLKILLIVFYWMYIFEHNFLLLVFSDLKMFSHTKCRAN